MGGVESTEPPLKEDEPTNVDDAVEVIEAQSSVHVVETPVAPTTAELIVDKEENTCSLDESTVVADETITTLTTSDSVIEADAGVVDCDDRASADADVHMETGSVVNKVSEAVTGSQSKVVARFQEAVDHYKKDYHHVSIDDKNMLFAYRKQAQRGPYTDDQMDFGFFDMVGRTRRALWQGLGEMSAEDAMTAYIDLLDICVPRFHKFLEAEKIAADERENARLKTLAEAKRRAEAAAYAIYAQNRIDIPKPTSVSSVTEAPVAAEEVPSEITSETSTLPKSIVSNVVEEDGVNLKHLSKEEIVEFRKTEEYLRQWIQHISADPDCSLSIGCGETVTVRVPTSVGSTNCLTTWEFATLGYDISFAVTFEYTDCGATKHDIILPPTRCDSHCHVMSGGHNSTTPGVYLLKFDNSYSLFRSKELFYRVYSQSRASFLTRNAGAESTAKHSTMSVPSNSSNQ